MSHNLYKNGWKIQDHFRITFGFISIFYLIGCYWNYFFSSSSNNIFVENSPVSEIISGETSKLQSYTPSTYFQNILTNDNFTCLVHFSKYHYVQYFFIFSIVICWWNLFSKYLFIKKYPFSKFMFQAESLNVQLRTWWNSHFEVPKSTQVIIHVQRV